MFGDGLMKYLHIVSAFIANNATTIYIDEVENGLHFSRMRLLLEKIINFIKKTKIVICKCLWLPIAKNL